MAETASGLPTLRLVMRHPVPLLVRRRGGGSRLADDVAETEVAVRGVRPEGMEELRLPVVRFRRGADQPDLLQRVASRFEGRLWTEVRGVASQLGRMSRLARNGQSPCRIRHGLYETGTPFWLGIAPHLVQLNASMGRETPDSVRRATVRDLSAEAAANLRRIGGDDMVHAGGRLYRAVSSPALVAHGEPRVEIPETLQGMGIGMVHTAHDHYVMPYARLADVEAFADLIGASHPKRLRMHRAVAEVARHVEGVEVRDDDLDAFVNAAPSELLDMLRQGEPGEELAASGDALWPWAALGSIGAVRGADRAEGVLAIRRVAEAIHAAHPIARHRNRCGFLVRYVDAIARPRLDAGRTLPEDDALSLGNLLPSA